MIIIGAGLSGLIAAHAWPQAKILERMKEPRAVHHALLRFRSDAVARAVGIEFTPVMVRKGIWFEGRYAAPNIALANMYSRKVIGELSGDRSIWNLDPVERWIAPESLYEQLVESVKGRMLWNATVKFSRATDDNKVIWVNGAATEPGPVISTAPLPETLRCIQGDAFKPEDFKRAPIRVDRYRVRNARVFQTVYFPDPELSVYRASITGSLLAIESVVRGDVMNELGVTHERDLIDICAAFGGIDDDLEPLDTVRQEFGKIVPLPDAQRRALLHWLTEHHGVYSLGRFATWRNVLLDDVIQDVAVIRRLLRSADYDRSLARSEPSGSY